MESESERDVRRLKQLVQYCRMRLKHDAYRAYVDKCLGDLSVLDPDPEMQGKLVQSDVSLPFDGETKAGLDALTIRPGVTR
jgi:hypothetical protein